MMLLMYSGTIMMFCKVSLLLLVRLKLLYNSFDIFSINFGGSS